MRKDFVISSSDQPENGTDRVEERLRRRLVGWRSELALLLVRVWEWPRAHIAPSFFLLPPQTALQELYQGLLLGSPAWGAAAYAAGYGVVWLTAAVVTLRLREWP